MLALQLILADGVTIKLGSNVWTLDLNFIIYLIVAAVVGLVAEALVGRRLPFGFVGAIIAALIGVWLRDIGHRYQWDWGFQRVWRPHFQSAGRRDHPGGNLAAPDVWSGAWPQTQLLCLIGGERALDAVWRQRK